METITIQVKPEIAQAYQRLNPEKKAKTETLLELLIKQELDLPWCLDAIAIIPFIQTQTFIGSIAINFSLECNNSITSIGMGI